MPDDNVPDLIPAVIAKTETASGSSDIHGRLRVVETLVESHDKRIGNNERLIAQFKEDLGEIRGFLGYAATKDDVAGLKATINQAVNVVLRDALNAMPVKQAAIWGGVVALATIGMLLVTLLR